MKRTYLVAGWMKIAPDCPFLKDQHGQNGHASTKLTSYAHVLSHGISAAMTW